jgi:YidC/Oxa1 family membrane protein insertase
MAKMKIIAPKMKALQEQYANDKQQLQVKMMEMYKTEKINPSRRLPAHPRADPGVHRAVLGAPVGGRAAPGALDPVDHDLSAPDPYFVLPVIYAITRTCRSSSRRRRSAIQCRRR